MRELTYKVMSGIGNGKTKKHGSMLDLVLAIPYFYSARSEIPPLAVLNNVLRSGVCDAGMSGGCAWTSFEIDEEEYRELVEELLTLPYSQSMRRPTLRKGPVRPRRPEDPAPFIGKPVVAPDGEERWRFRATILCGPGADVAPW